MVKGTGSVQLACLLEFLRKKGFRCVIFFFFFVCVSLCV